MKPNEKEFGPIALHAELSGWDKPKPSARVHVTTRNRGDIPNITPPDQPYKVEIPSIAVIEAIEVAMFRGELEPKRTDKCSDL